MTKKQARLTPEKAFTNQTDKVLNSYEQTSNTTIQQDIQSNRHQDTIKKLTFQIRESLYKRLKDLHYLLGKDLDDDSLNREVIVEEAIARILNVEGDSREELAKAVQERQKIREQELDQGLLLRVRSKKEK